MSTSPTSESKPLTANPDAWCGFKPGLWHSDVNVRWFLQQNYTPYDGDDKFLALATERTKRIWKKGGRNSEWNTN